METIALPCFNSTSEFFLLIFKQLLRSVSLKFVHPANKLLPDFREKLILAITGINNCAHFSFLHTRIAIENGVKISEVKRLLEGNLGTFPKDEAAVLLYARHWTETKGKVSSLERKKVIDFFGPRETKLTGVCHNVCTFFKSVQQHCHRLQRKKCRSTVPSFYTCYHHQQPLL